MGFVWFFLGGGYVLNGEKYFMMWKLHGTQIS